MATDQAHVAHSTSSRLARLEALVRWLTLLRGLGIVVTVLCGLVAIGLLTDLFLDLGSGVRATILLVTGCVTAVAGWRVMLSPALRQTDASELAAIVEIANPGMDERLSSTIELEDPDLADAWRGSDYMRHALAREAAESIRRVRVERSVAVGRPVRTLSIGLLAVFALLLPLMIRPDACRLLFARYVNPWGNFARVSNLFFEVPDGDRVVPRGSDVIVRAVPHWRSTSEDLPEHAWLNWTSRQGETDSRRMEFDTESGSYVATLPHVFTDFIYTVSADDALTRKYAITVVNPPEITAVSLEVVPPPYTGRPSKIHDGVVGEIPVFERSRMSFRLSFNKPVTAAELRWAGPDSANRDITDQQASHDMESLAISPDGTAATLELRANRGGSFEFALLDEYELGNPEEPYRSIQFMPDRPPDLALSGENVVEQARPTDVLPISVTVSDDVGVGVGVLELHLDDGDQPIDVVSLPRGELGRRHLDHDFRIDLSQLDLPVGSVVGYQVLAADERPAPRPNEVWSDRRVLTIREDAAAPGTQQLAASQEDVKAALQGVRRDVRANREDLRQLLEQANRDPAAFKQAEVVRQKSQAQTDLAQELEAVADRLADHPLFASLTQRAREVSRRDLAAAASHSAQAADEQDHGRRSESMNQAIQQLDAAENGLNQILQQFDQLAELERDLRELNRLADQTERVAQRALGLEQKRRDSPDDIPATDRQERLEQFADQQRELMEEQQGLTLQLQELLQRRPELLEAARADQIARLRELAEQARRLAEPQDLLAHALNEEARQTTQAVQPVINQQRRIQSQAQQLASQTASQPDATPIDPELLRRAIEELQRGNLTEGEDLQAQAAEQLEQLAEALRVSVDESDPQAAARELAQRQRELQQRVAEAAAQAPAADASEQEQQAFNDQQQDQQMADTAQDLSDRLRAMNEQLDQIREERTANAPQPSSRQLARQQQQLADAAEQLSSEVAAETGDNSAPAQKFREFAQLSESAATQAEQGNMDQAAAAAQRAAQQAQAAAAEVSQQGSEQLSEQTAELSDQQMQLAEDLEQAAAMTQSGSAADDRGSQSPAEQSLAQQQQLAQDAVQLVENSTRELGRDAPATQQARHVAQRARRTALEARAGRFGQAAENGRQAAFHAAQAANQSADSPNVNEQARDLAQRHNELSERFDQLAEAPHSRNEAQQQSQAEMVPAAQRLSDALVDAAEQLSLPMFNLQYQSKQAKMAGAETAQAQQAMQQAGSRMQDANARQAAEQAREAADALQRAAQMANQATAGQQSHSNSPVPAEVGMQIAEAVQQLQQAAEQMARAESEQLNDASMPQGTPAESANLQGQPSGEQGQPSGQQGQASDRQGASPGEMASNSQGSSSSSSSGSSRSNGDSQSAMSQAAQSLQQAAQALAQAARHAQPSLMMSRQGGRAGQGNQDSSRNAPNMSASAQQDAQTAASVPKAIAAGLDDLLTVSPGQLTADEIEARDWGRLPGKLRTEILQAARDNPNSDYARLIKIYFREIASTPDPNDDAE